MHVITRKRLREFAQAYPASESSMNRWFKVVDTGEFKTFAELRDTFNSVDKVGKYTVFNIGGNNYRIIAVVHYNRQKLYIRDVLTHSDYDRGDWAE